MNPFINLLFSFLLGSSHEDIIRIGDDNSPEPILMNFPVVSVSGSGSRALILEPKLIICDEPVSALDVSIQAQVINLLMALQKEMDLSLIFIAHDLSVVQHISTRVMVLYLGSVVEITNSDDLYENPSHPYTRALIAAVPDVERTIAIDHGTYMTEGELPSPLSPPSGCAFHTRCPMAQDICAKEKPALMEPANGHSVACHCHDVAQCT